MRSPRDDVKFLYQNLEVKLEEEHAMLCDAMPWAVDVLGADAGEDGEEEADG